MSANLIVMTVSSFAILAALVLLLNWRKNTALYLVFVITAALFYTWMSHILVLGGFLEFSWRLFPAYTLNNILYDLIVFPGFTLLMIVLALRKRYGFWPGMVIFSAVIALQDYLAAQYSNMVIMKNWSALNTFIGCITLYTVWFIYYRWLDRHIKKKTV